MKITTKGQVTIPQDIREKAGLLPNTEVKFEFVRGKVMLVPVGGKKSRGTSIVNSMRGSIKHLGMSTDELMAFTRGEK
jgi:AbrB family looped-hinge helix DNA binding protein